MTSRPQSGPIELPREHRGSFAIWGSYWALFMLIAALYSVMSWVTPLYLDDWAYMGNWRDDVHNTEFSLDGLVAYATYVRGYDNGRIPNMIAPLESMFSPLKELFPFLTGILLALSITISQWFASNERSYLKLAVTWIFFILFLPWSDTLFENIYSFNYIWAGGITLIFLYLLRRGEKRGWNTTLFVLCLVLAVLAGGWHESMAIATVCGLCLLVLQRRFRLSGRFYCALAIYFLSAVAFMLSPGMLGRIGGNVGVSEFHVLYKSFAILFLLGIVVFLLTLFRKGRETLKNAWKSDIAIVALGVIIGGYFIGIVAANTPRSYYWPNLAAVILTLYLLFHQKWDSMNWIKMVAADILVALSTLQTISAIYWQSRYTDDWERIMVQLERSDTGTVFYDSPNPAYSPHYTLGIPYSRAWRSPYHYRLLWSYYMKPVIGVVPTDLKMVSPEDGETLQGNIEARVYKGHLISPFEKIDTSTYIIAPAFREIEVTLPGGEQTTGVYVAVPFITQKGDTLLYYTKY